MRVVLPEISFSGTELNFELLEFELELVIMELSFSDIISEFLLI